VKLTKKIIDIWKRFFGRRQAASTKIPDWAVIPPLERKVVLGTRTWYSSEVDAQVDLGNLSCSCARWREQARDRAPENTIGRCCDHLVRAVRVELTHNNIKVDPWVLYVLTACFKSFAPPASFEGKFFSNSVDNFLALYDTARGYVQLYGPSRNPVQWGYDSSRNRWANGFGPEHPLIIKKALRPWVSELNKKYGN
jgi:hypothetical protein